MFLSRVLHEEDVEVILSPRLVVTTPTEHIAISVLVVMLLAARLAQKELLYHTVQIQHQSEAITSHVSQRPPILVIASFQSALSVQLHRSLIGMQHVLFFTSN